MSDFLLYYSRPNPTTWVYMSSFLTIGLFFVFRRFWSIRNLDIFLLILLAPGLLIVHEGYRQQLAQSESLAAQRIEEAAHEKMGQSSETSSANFSSAVLTNALPILALVDETAGVKEAADADGNNEDLAVSDPLSAVNPGDPISQSDQEATRITPLELQRVGFVYLFIVEALILLRLMLDPLMVRRPLLDPNLTSGGLTFIGISMFIFMMANVVNSDSRIQVTQGPALGPGYALMNMLPAIPTRPISDAPGGVSPPMSSELTPSQRNLARIAKTLAIAAQLAIVTGIVLIANRHFGNLQAGVGCATLYLMLPYTAQMTGRVDHVVPAALLLWAILSYRRPMIAGVFMGLACGLVYYPLFLLPLWFSFYWQRGARGFLISVTAMLAILIVCLSFDDSLTITEHLQRMFGVLNPNKDASELRGFWALGLDPIWRLPVIVAFVILCVFFAIWPAQKNLATLLSGSAAVMAAAQFWHGYGGGLYIAWFLPLLLLTIFRPNLQDRVATKVVSIRSDRSAGRSTVRLD